MRHEKQKLSERVMFLTTPGFFDGGDSRKKIGLRGGGPSRVITDKAVMGFDETTRRMKLISVHPDVSVDDVVANTGFPLIIPDKVKTTPPPTKEQLRYIREVIDPERWFTG
jgi:glutaconate CoA-transferase subunit B